MKKFATFFLNLSLAVGLSTCGNDNGGQDGGDLQDNVPLRVVSAGSISNTEILVTFSESVLGGPDGAENPASYRIVASKTPGTMLIQGTLTVKQAELLLPDRIRVKLTTFSQSDLEYTLTVSGVTDLAGNPIAPEEPWGVNPSTVTFFGTPPGEDDLVDSDGDGLADVAEQRGWTVTVLLANGVSTERGVTSDPTNPDTDGDGVSDATEKVFLLDPRAADTDGDDLTDAQELNEIYSTPFSQDTDGDGLADGLEFNFFRVSPILADTDGDQFSDDEELLELDRDPLIADLPRSQILVGDARLSLNVISSYTDETGTTRDVEETLHTTFGESRERLFGTSDIVSNETSLTHGETIGGEVSYSVADGFGAKGSFEASFGQTYTNGFTSAVDRQSAETASQEYQESVRRAFSESENRSVTRTVEEAEIVADVSIQNLSNIAFSMTNLEISVLQQDRRSSNRFVPIAALRLAGADDPGNQPSFNLGPFDPERGPFIFKSFGVFPNLVEALLREPQGLVYRVVNFDLLDEFGRNFVFSSQDVNDRTAGITIDFGGGEVEMYRVATHNCFDASGQMLPISMERALEIVGIMKSADPSGDVVNADPDDPEIRVTYGTQRDLTDGVEVLTRIRGVQTDFASTSPEKRFWAVVSANRRVPATIDFSSIGLRARDNFVLMFTRDLDQDGLLEREEIFYGSSDASVDSDGDSLGDYDEVRTGWSVTLKGGSVIKVFSSPASLDTDGDGLTDDVEMEFGTDPTREDTDFDGLSDAIEIFGPIEILLFDGDEDTTNNPLLIVPRYEGPPTIVNAFNGICDTTAVSDDVQVVSPGQAAEDGQVVVSAGPNGQIDSFPGGDDYVRVAHDQDCRTDPLNRDTDFDGVSDGREPILGVNPNRADAGSVLDSDNDGLSDDEEDTGWLTVVNGGVPTVVTSDKFRADTDRDGIPDVYERAIGTNPRLPYGRDTDGDTLFDYREFDPDDALGIYDGLVLADAADRCADASACIYDPPDPLLLIGTDPREEDTDGDGREDNIELSEGWTVQAYGGQPSIVYSDPKYADEDDDGLNDGQEFTNRTDPQDADTDGDGRLDGAELPVGLDPLRQDYHLEATLTTVYVIEDCDYATREGLEMEGDFWLQKPDGTSELLHSEGCHSEEGACEVRDCCISEGDGQPCDGESLVFNKSHTFVFRQGESFTLYTSTLLDNDDYYCPGLVYESIGSFSQSFNFTLSPTSPFSRSIGGGGCHVTVNYTLTRVD